MDIGGRIDKAVASFASLPSTRLEPNALMGCLLEWGAGRSVGSVWQCDLVSMRTDTYSAFRVGSTYGASPDPRLLSHLEVIHRASDASASFVQHVGVDHCGLHARVPQQFLDRSNVVARFQLRLSIRDLIGSLLGCSETRSPGPAPPLGASGMAGRAATGPRGGAGPK